MKKSFLKWTVITFAAVSCIDGAVAYGLAHPDFLLRAPSGYRAFIRGIYLDGARNVIQFEPDCARYNSELTYTLKPGEFFFSNPEYNTKYRVNSLGMRSAEEDLRAPDVIVIGDSRAMGWGVGQEDMYTELLRQWTGFKTLNAAVSSYGTVREMKLLDRLDTTRLKYLVLHYVDNDYEENASFRQHDNFLNIMEREKYEKIQRQYLSSKRYYFGKYTFFFLYRVGAEVYTTYLRLRGIDELKSDVPYFLNALIHGRKTPLDGPRLVVMANGKFLERLKREIAANEYPAYVENMILVSDDVSESGYFVLDNHMNQKGHRFLAERLRPVLK